jgi:hypothetical protein
LVGILLDCVVSGDLNPRLAASDDICILHQTSHCLWVVDDEVVYVVVVDNIRDLLLPR